jgi:hypothetical protein
MDSELITRDFDLMGPVLKVEAQEERLIRPFAAILRGLDVDADRTPVFTLTIREGVPSAVPDSAMTVYQGPVFNEGECVFADDDGRLCLLFPDRVSLVLSADGGRGDIVAAPDYVSRIGATPGMMAVDAAIDATGQFILHAAGLTLPGSNAQVLVFAQSGTGKTTTALALADSGFGLCTDDAMVVRLGDAGATGWGLPRDLKVHRNTAEMMPWLKPYMTGKWDTAGEQAVSRAALSDRIRIEKAEQRPIAGVFLLERGSGDACSVAPLTQTDALVYLAADNVRTGKTGLLAGQRRRFASLASLVSRAPTFRITLGGHPKSTAAALLQALGQAAT